MLLSTTIVHALCPGMTESSIDKMMPTTEEEFTQFEEALKSKITFFEVRAYLKEKKCYDQHPVLYCK